MPYINMIQRRDVDKELNALINNLMEVDSESLPGIVNYCVSKMLWSLCGKGHSEGVKRYHRMNAMIGALQCVQLELYRRVVVPYEDEKIEQEGDIIE